MLEQLKRWCQNGLDRLRSALAPRRQQPVRVPVPVTIDPPGRD